MLLAPWKLQAPKTWTRFISQPWNEQLGCFRITWTTLWLQMQVLHTSMSWTLSFAICSIVPVSGFNFLQKGSCDTCPFAFTQCLWDSRGICQYNFWNARHICGTNILTVTSVTSVGWWPCCQMAIPPVQSNCRWEGWPREYNHYGTPSGILFAFDLSVHASPCAIP